MYPSNPKAYGEHYDPQPPIADGFPVVSTTVSSQYPSAPPLQFRPETPVAWSTGLCDCFSDMRNCCITCWCPFITFGQIAEILDEGSMTCSASGALYAAIAYTTGHACLYSCMYRTKMRRQYTLEESPCNDCLVHWCCECCALCQEYRQLQNQGFDMLIGWQGNVERQNRGVAMTPIAPTVEPGMSR